MGKPEHKEEEILWVLREELQGRNCSRSAIRGYLLALEQFSEHWGTNYMRWPRDRIASRSPDILRAQPFDMR